MNVWTDNASETVLVSTIGKHELLTPLHAIDGALELLIDGSIAKLDSDARDVVGIIAASARDLRRNLDLLLDYLETADRKPAFRSLHPLADLASALGLDGPSSASSAVSIEIDLAGLQKATNILRDYSGLGRHRNLESWQVGVDAVTIGLGSLATDLSAGEGELSLFIASRLMEAAGGKLERNEANTVSIRIRRQDLTV